MTDVNEAGGYRKPETEFEHWVSQVATGVQAVKNGIFDSFFVTPDGEKGIIVDSSNVDYEIGRVMCLSQDLGIVIDRERALGESYNPMQMRTPLDYADFQAEMDAFRAAQQDTGFTA